MDACAICKVAYDGSPSQDYLLCNGICGRPFHYTCVGLKNENILKFFKKCKNLFWQCDQCIHMPSKVILDTLKDLKLDIAAIKNHLHLTPARTTDNASTSKPPRSQLSSTVPPPSLTITAPTSSLSTASPPVNMSHTPITSAPITPTTLSPTSLPIPTSPLPPSNIIPTVLSNQPNALQSPIIDPVTACLEVVSPPKSIFISRLAYKTSSNDIINYINHKLLFIPTYLKCIKLTPENQPHRIMASFKIDVPPDVAEYLYKDFWPPGILIKDFVPRRNQRLTNPNVVTLPSSAIPNPSNVTSASTSKN